MYYNTTNETDEVLTRSRRKVLSQEDKILKIFNLIPERPMGPNLVMKMYATEYENPIPITSIRRAITDLTNSGKLVKTTTKEMGGYGKPEYTWRLKQEEDVNV